MAAVLVSLPVLLVHGFTGWPDVIVAASGIVAESHVVPAASIVVTSRACFCST